MAVAAERSRHGSGPARIPDPATGTAGYGRIHTLGISGTSIAVVFVPFKDAAPEVTVNRVDGDTVQIRIDDAVDVISTTRWTRSGAERAEVTWGEK